jgi:hypothetical protein
MRLNAPGFCRLHAVSQGHLYAVNLGDGTISQFTIESDNTLTPMTPIAVTNPGMHTFGTGTPGAVTVDPSGSFEPVSIRASTLGIYAVNSGAPGDTVAPYPASMAIRILLDP